MIRKAIIPVVAFASIATVPVTLSVAAAQLATVAHEIDEYTTPDLSAHTDNLDNWIIALQNDPPSQGYVIAYGRRPGDAQKAADNQIDYAVNVRGVDSGRLASANGGYREVPAIELWILRNGAAPPKPRSAKPKR
jgi:hypothetical protein